MKWKEIKSNSMKTYQLEEEPEVIHVFRIRDNEYMVVHEDGYDLNTGKVEFYSEKTLNRTFGITI